MPPTEPIRLGVVGCARILPAHLRGIATLRAAGLDPIRITALCARNADDAHRFAVRGEGPPPRQPASDNPADPLGAPHAYVSDLHPEVLPEIFTDWRAMLDAEVIDAALILTPVSSHHEIALTALSAGKHVLIEKPLAISVRAGRAIVAEADRRGLVAGVAESVRYGERTRALRWALDAGLVGTPQVWLSGGVGGEWAPDRIVAHTPWRHRLLDAAGGPAIDHGVHLMNQIRYLMGPVDEISALTRTLEPTRFGAGTSVANELEDIYLAQLRFASGAIGTAFSGWAGRGAAAALEASPVIYGSTGCIKGEDVYGDEGPLGRATDLLAERAPGALRERQFPAGVRDPFALELLAFVRAITGSGDEPSAMETSAEDGLADLATSFAILESAHARQPVRVADVAQGTVDRYQAEIDEYYCL